MLLKKKFPNTSKICTLDTYSVNKDNGQFPGRYVCQKLKNLCDTDGWRVKQNETASLCSVACFPSDPSWFLLGTEHVTVLWLVYLN